VGGEACRTWERRGTRSHRRGLGGCSVVERGRGYRSRIQLKDWIRPKKLDTTQLEGPHTTQGLDTTKGPHSTQGLGFGTPKDWIKHCNRRVVDHIQINWISGFQLFPRVVFEVGVADPLRPLPVASPQSLPFSDVWAHVA
jgi:hypothetical protein